MGLDIEIPLAGLSTSMQIYRQSQVAGISTIKRFRVFPIDRLMLGELYIKSSFRTVVGGHYIHILEVAA